MKSANERYHDRIAARYDDVYGSAYWRFYREVSWRHLQGFLPSGRPARAADIGCGTGHFGIRLLKAGFAVDFVDLSQNMLDQAALRVERAGVRGEVAWWKRDAQDLDGIADGSLDFATLQGDPLSFCEEPRRAVQELARVLKPGAVAVASVDHLASGPAPYLDRGDVAGLERLLRNGTTEWLADKKDERFPMRMFSADTLSRLFEKGGFSVLALIGKTCLVKRQHEELLEDRATHLKLLALEESVHGERSFLGLAPHLQIVVRRD